MRILVTNDDGVGAPGIAALARAAHATGHDVVVVAPLVDYSGAGAAVGPVHSRDGVDYRSHVIEELDVPTYGIDGPPALAVILACVGAFGPRPDMVLSGVNHGINVGRSALHSGTVGAALTAAHFGLRALAASIRWGEEPVPWTTASTLAASLVPALAQSLEGTVLNLNVPNVSLREVRGVRHGRLSRGGAIRSAVHDTGTPGARDAEPPRPHLSLPPAGSGTLRLDLAPPGQRRREERRSEDELDSADDLETDAGLIAADFASLTALVGVREAVGGADEVVAEGVRLLGALLADETTRQPATARPAAGGAAAG